VLPCVRFSTMLLWHSIQLLWSIRLFFGVIAMGSGKFCSVKALNDCSRFPLSICICIQNHVVNGTEHMWLRCGGLLSAKSHIAVA